MEQTTGAPSGEPALPVPIIVVIAIGGYLLLIVILLVIREILKGRGMCASCALCGKEDGSQQCCDCWISCAESCNCCAYPNVKSCLDSVCGPADDRCSIGKCLACQSCQNLNCCGDSSDTGCEYCCSCSDTPCEGCCSGDGCISLECAGCDCACQAPECDTIDCLCFKINMHN